MIALDDVVDFQGRLDTLKVEYPQVASPATEAVVQTSTIKDETVITTTTERVNPYVVGDVDAEWD